MLIPIENRIFIIRGEYVMLDRDLAELFGVTTKVFKQAVKRNIVRFPDDFMFELGSVELRILRSQIVTSKTRDPRGGDQYVPFAFTEQGVAMLSGVLRSPRAVQVNIQIMRSFIRLRQMILSHEDLRLKLDSLEKRYDEQFKIVFDAMRRMITEDEEERAEIGFKENTPPVADGV